MSGGEAVCPRNRALDGLKTLAALLIVGGHVLGEYAFRNGASPAVGFLFGLAQLGVPAFFVTAGVLQGARLAASRAPRWLARRERRLLVPYAVWSGVYLLAAFGASVAGIAPRPRLDLLGVLLFGQAFQTLWFLPALIYCVAIAWLMLRFLTPPTALLCAAVVTLAASASGWAPPLGLALWLPLYLASVWLGAGEPGPVLPEVALAAVAVALLFSCAAVYATRGVAPGALDLVAKALASLAALALAALALRRPGAGPLAVLAPGAPLLLGMYLVHPLVERAIVKVWPAAGAPAVPWLVAVFLMTAATSAVIVAGMIRVPWMRTVV